MDVQKQFEQNKTKKTFYDLTYKKFGDLTVQYRAEENYTTANFAEPMWVCRCGCGNYVTVRGSKLRNGEQKTCGNCVKNLKVDLGEYHFDKSIRSERTALTYLKRNLHSDELEDKISAEEKQRIHDLKMQWMVFWRKNINLYIHYKMGINSFPYQHYGYYQMQEATDFFEISTRGTSKSLKAVTYSVAKCLLYPGTKVGLGAVTKSQAEQDFNETFTQELVGKFSWLLKFLERFDKITWRVGDKGPEVYFWNNSSIIFFPVIDSSRGGEIDKLIIITLKGIL